MGVIFTSLLFRISHDKFYRSDLCDSVDKRWVPSKTNLKERTAL